MVSQGGGRIVQIGSFSGQRANMAGADTPFKGSLSMNIVDVLDLEIASFGSWDDPEAECGLGHASSPSTSLGGTLRS